MSERPYPEAIRGAWFLLPVDTTLAQAHKDQLHDVLIFHLDNSYQQLSIKAGVVKNTSRGNYTFDGDFLITRGRTTDTYRVLMKDSTRWSIETKKGMRPMLRTLTTHIATLDEDQHKDLRILPIKARATPLFDHPHSPLTLVMDDIQLAVLSVDRWEEQKTCWLGILPLVEGIEEKTWLRIMQESVFALTLEETDGRFDKLEVLMIHQRDALTHTIQV